MKPFIIAELCSNVSTTWWFDHWCAVAARVGADAVKVQIFKAEHFPYAERASKRPLEFPRSKITEFVQAAHKYGLQAGASVFDNEAVDLAAAHCDFLKLAAREMENFTLINRVVRTGKPFYRSIDTSKESIERGEHFLDYTEHKALWAIPQYPTPMLKAVWFIATHRADFQDGFGWSSHTHGDYDVRLAVAFGAPTIEKHLALSPTDIEAGHSLLPHEFAAMVKAVRGE